MVCVRIPFNRSTWICFREAILWCSRQISASEVQKIAKELIVCRNMMSRFGIGCDKGRSHRQPKFPLF